MIGSQTYGGDVTLGSDTSISSLNGNGDITFTGTVQGLGDNLTVTTGGLTTFGGAVGGSGNPLANLTTNGGGVTRINGGAIDTTGGTQTYFDNVTLGQSLTVLTGIITFNSALTLGATATTATGTLQIVGDLTFVNTTTLTSTFAGRGATQYGHIVVAGNTDYGSATFVPNYRGFTPAPDNTFGVVTTGGSGVGQFANAPAPGPVLLGGVRYLVSYAGGDFLLKVVNPLQGARLLRVTPWTTVAVPPAGRRFQVKLVNALGVPMAGVAVTFRAPLTGPTGLFAGRFATVTALTNAQGIATSPLLFPSGRKGVYYYVLAQVGPLTLPFRAINPLSLMTRV